MKPCSTSSEKTPTFTLRQPRFLEPTSRYRIRRTQEWSVKSQISLSYTEREQEGYRHNFTKTTDLSPPWTSASSGTPTTIVRIRDYAPPPIVMLVYIGNAETLNCGTAGSVGFDPRDLD